MNLLWFTVMRHGGITTGQHGADQQLQLVIKQDCQALFPAPPGRLTTNEEYRQ